MRKMLEPHRGAVAMSECRAAKWSELHVARTSAKDKNENEEEAVMVEAMLSGVSHDEAMTASTAKPAVENGAERASERGRPSAAARTASVAPPAAP